MTRQTGLIITIVVAVLTLCCSLACCGNGIYMMATSGEYTEVLGTYTEWYYGVPGICLGILVWIIPLLLWLFLVRGKEA